MLWNKLKVLYKMNLNTYFSSISDVSLLLILNCIVITNGQFPRIFQLGTRNTQPSNQCSTTEIETPLPRPSNGTRGQTSPVVSFISSFSWRFFKVSILRYKTRCLDSSKNMLLSFQESRLNSDKGNYVLSPISAQILLALLERAATEPTKQEILNVIQTSQPTLIGKVINDMKTSRDSNKLDLGTAVFTSRELTLNQNFLALAKSSQVQIKPINFYNQNEALQTINGWAASETRSQIPSILSPNYDFAPLRVLLMNVVYFRGVWEIPFKNTTNGIFYSSPQITKPVTYMNAKQLWKGGDYRQNNYALRWLQIPYQHDEYSMVVIMPLDKFNLEQVISGLTESNFQDLINSIESTKKRNVQLTMPKFQIKSRVTLLPSLKRVRSFNILNN